LGDDRALVDVVAREAGAVGTDLRVGSVDNLRRDRRHSVGRCLARVGLQRAGCRHHEVQRGLTDCVVGPDNHAEVPVGTRGQRRDDPAGGSGDGAGDVRPGREGVVVRDRPSAATGRGADSVPVLHIPVVLQSQHVRHRAVRAGHLRLGLRRVADGVVVVAGEGHVAPVADQHVGLLLDALHGLGQYGISGRGGRRVHRGARREQDGACLVVSHGIVRRHVNAQRDRGAGRYGSRAPAGSRDHGSDVVAAGIEVLRGPAGGESGGGRGGQEERVGDVAVVGDLQCVAGRHVRWHLLRPRLVVPGGVELIITEEHGTRRVADHHVGPVDSGLRGQGPDDVLHPPVGNRPRRDQQLLHRVSAH